MGDKIDEIIDKKMDEKIVGEIDGYWDNMLSLSLIPNKEKVILKVYYSFLVLVGHFLTRHT